MSDPLTRTYERFPLARRIEHWVMMLSFTLLALTGLPQRFSSSPISIAFVGLLGGIETIRTIHHIAAIVMMLGTAWHLLVFGYLAYVRRTRMTMLPTLQDAKDAWQQFLYNIGRAPSPPQMGRYTFEEKMEYWAFVWGAMIMGVTGFMMWNPITTARFLPGEVIPAAKAAHGGEALLAVLAIIIWHMYGVHIKRFNKSMFTGKMTEEEMLHEHPLELADIKAGITEPAPDPVEVRKRQRVYFPVAAVLALFMLLGVYGFVNAETTALTTVERQVPTQVVFVPWTPTPAPTLTPTVPVSDPTWENSIGVLLQARCSSCHGVRAMGGLNISTYEGLMEGGASGPVVVPGDSTNSVLVQVQQAGNHPGQLTAEDLARVIAWIDAGAPEN